MAFSSRVRFAILLLSLEACGAKTGLRVPDVGFDGTIARDAGVDTRDARADVPCIVLPLDGGIFELPLSTEVVVGRADVVFLIDTTASMGQEIDQIRNNLRDRLVPGIRQAIPDSQLAVATFADFPESPCGGTGDLPFRLIQPSTTDLTRAQTAVNSIGLDSGRDEPEAQVEALFQLATGAGLPPYLQANFGCPAGGNGFACFRTDALPVVLLFTDAPFHNGPGGRNPYECATRATPHRYEQALSAMNNLGVKVMGLYSGPASGEGLRDLNTVAFDTGAIDNGIPIVFDIGARGERLSEGVITSIRTLASVVLFDIDTTLVASPRNGIDPRMFVESVVPLRAEPMSGVGQIDTAARVFRRVRTGTRVVFQMRLRNNSVAPGVGPQRFSIEIVFRGDGRTRLGSQTIEVVVPGADGTGCE